MNNWFLKNTKSLSGKTALITGATGDLGREICFHLAGLGANLLFLDRNLQKSLKLEEDIKSRYPETRISRIILDLFDIESVKAAAEELKQKEIDFLILNSAVYSVPREISNLGFDNVFQINFVSHYYLVKELLPRLRERQGRVVVMGSIAYNYSKTNPADIDFKSVKSCEKVYGNSKRYLMFSLLELFKNENKASLSVVHPGISFTNITSHYPKFIFAIIKYPMKLIFMKPKKASLCAISGIFKDAGYKEWIGPRLFNVWGMPTVKKLTGCSSEESRRIFESAEEIYNKITNKEFKNKDVEK